MESPQRSRAPAGLAEVLNVLLLQSLTPEALRASGVVFSQPSTFLVAIYLQLCKYERAAMIVLFFSFVSFVIHNS